MNAYRYLPLILAIVGATLFLLLPKESLAANLYWVGADGAAFSTASNWKTTDPASCGGGDALSAPASTDVAIFDADCDNGASMTGTVNVQGINLNTGYSGSVSPSSAISITLGSSGFVQAAGTFTATAGTMTISNGPFTKSGGTFTHNSGTVAFTGSTTIDVATSETFYNVTKSTTATTLTISSGDTIVVVGTLTVTGGSIATGTVEAQGNVVVSDELTGSGSAALTFTGSATTQTVSFSGVPGYWDGNVTINKTSGTVQLLTAWSLTNSTQTTTLQSGTLDLNGQTLTVGGGTTTFTQSGGTFTGGSGTLDINGHFELSGGTFTAPGSSGAMSLLGNFTHTAGGTFTHNSGTVTLDGSTATINVATSETFYNLTVSAGGTKTITSGDTIITVGTLTLTAGSANTGTLEAQGDVTAASGWGGGTAPLLFSGSTTQTFTLGAAGVIDADITVNKSGGQVNLASALTMDGSAQDLIIAEGTFDIASFNLTVNGTSGTFVVQDGGVFQLQGGETVTANASNPQLQSGSTVTYDGTAGPYTIKDYTYHHLRFNGSGGVFNAGASETLGGNLTISAGTFDISGFNLTVTGTYANDDKFRLQGGETTVSLTMDTDSGITEYDGTSSYTGLKAGNNYYDLIFNGSGTWTLNAALDVNDDLTLTTGTLDVSTSNFGIQVAGDWTNNATFTPRSGTVTLDGADQTLVGATTFYKLTKNVSSAATLTLPASTLQTITNTLTLGGASGAALSLRSSVTGTQARLDPQGTRTLSYLDVKDNWNTNSTIMNCATGCVDSGNNTNWFAGASNSAPQATTPSSISQATNGTGVLTFKTTLSDSNMDVTRLKIEYATNLGDWEDPTISDVTSSRGSVSRDNNATYQLSSIDTDGGEVELTITWTTKSQLTNIEDSSVYLRLIPNDGTADGSAVISSAFTVDNKAPAVSTITLDDRTATSITLKWVPGATDISFQRYTVCYGTNATHVNNCNNTAKVWTETNDPDLTAQTTNTTTITGLTTNANYRFLLRGHDSKGNVSKLLSSTFVPSDTPLAPVLAADAIQDTTISVFWNRIQDAAFIRTELCYGRVLSRVNGSTCNANGNPDQAVKKTFTSPTTLSDVITDLRTSTLYYMRVFVFYTGYSTQRSNTLQATTCPAGQHRVNNVCVDIAQPSPDPTPPPVASPDPTPSPSPSASPEASPTPTTTPLPSDSLTPSPTPDTIIGGITEGLQNIIETTIEVIAAVVENVIAVVQQVIALAREFITSPATAIPRAQAALQPIVEQPAFQATAAVATAAAVVSVAAQASVLTSAPSFLSQLPQAIERLWQGLLGLLGFRRKKRPWGRVVDAATGEAVAGAYVQVFDHQTKKLQNTMVTNAKGAFSSLVPAGMYEFRVHKPGWTLTPQAPFLRLVAGEQIFDGKPVTVTEAKILPLVLALRMTEAVPLTQHLLWRKTLQTAELFIARLSWPLLILGAILNSLTLFASPSRLTIAVEIFYAVLIAWKVRLRLIQRPAIGFVRDAATGRPLDLALVRLYDAVTGKLIETRTTTAEGKFLLLPSPGVYTISVVREGYAPYREGHVVVDPKREALALAFTLQPQPLGQFGVAIGTPQSPLAQ